jgi:phage-related protein
MREEFWIDGVSGASLGIFLQGPVTFSAPTPRLETVTVPGRNGVLHLWDGAYELVSGTADCVAVGDCVEETLSALNALLLRTPGFHRLELSGEPGIYREGVVTLGPALDPRAHRVAPFTLTMDCRPQRFYVAGEEPLRLNGTMHLYNPGFPALPRLCLQGNGTLTLGETTVTVTGNPGTLVLDSALELVSYPEGVGDCTVTMTDFPVLGPGEDRVTVKGFSQVDMVPRWWTL